jgi:metal-responsive CopG/Arc/MetJ family transcriptional regulator
MNYVLRRAPLLRGRRIAVNVNLAPETHRHLVKKGKGNRSAAIEELVRQDIERERASSESESEVA